jgi:hypothetical protein
MQHGMSRGIVIIQFIRLMLQSHHKGHRQYNNGFQVKYLVTPMNYAYPIGEIYSDQLTAYLSMSRGYNDFLSLPDNCS